MEWLQIHVPTDNDGVFCNDYMINMGKTRRQFYNVNVDFDLGVYPTMLNISFPCYDVSVKTF